MTVAKICGQNIKIIWTSYNIKGYVRYIFASLFCKSKEEQLWNQKKKKYFTSKTLFILEIIKF